MYITHSMANHNTKEKKNYSKHVPFSYYLETPVEKKKIIDYLLDIYAPY